MIGVPAVEYLRCDWNFVTPSMPAKKKSQFSKRPKPATIAAKAKKASALFKAGRRATPLKHPFIPSDFERVLSEASYVTQGHVIITTHQGHVEINKMFPQQKVRANEFK